jgi:hypothetical protein
VLFRFELRHDIAEGATYFRGNEGASYVGPRAPTSRKQDTFAAGNGGLVLSHECARSALS